MMGFLGLFVLTLSLASSGFASPAAATGSGNSAAASSSSSLSLGRALVGGASRAKRQDYFYDSGVGYNPGYDCKECLCKREGNTCSIAPVCGPCDRLCGKDCFCAPSGGDCEWTCFEQGGCSG